MIGTVIFTSFFISDSYYTYPLRGNTVQWVPTNPPDFTCVQLYALAKGL